MNLRSACVGLAFLAAANAAQAIYTINIDQVGADVVMTGSGSLNTSSMSALTTIGLCAAGHGLIHNNAICIGTETTADMFSGVLFPSLTGVASTPQAGTGSMGPGVYILGADLYLPENYISEASISNSTTFAGTTLAGAGLTVGTRTLFLPSGDEIIINIGLAPPPVVPAANIPTLSEYALMAMASMMAMLGVAAVRRRRG
ncbi:IPTL-CTERM sorting domain-containing protein [Acidovorax sp. sif1233]|uniref:IPTL-CTERM sorting domain-containing protein n=1 Tax=Acidovorax sp. sif1233 TaxID=2854792 RepID=UPI001C48A4DA|nr:IPTL-CTERM sorting domain-containing protein [Acidovorax sp. sif1233]MBV7454620.1 IPTL-CTERM sorting domain-containing protein [Acidovorax sp. sif1233]